MRIIGWVFTQIIWAKMHTYASSAAAAAAAAACHIHFAFFFSQYSHFFCSVCQLGTHTLWFGEAVSVCVYIAKWRDPVYSCRTRPVNETETFHLFAQKYGNKFGHFYDFDSFCMQIIRMKLINPPTHGQSVTVESHRLSGGLYDPWWTNKAIWFTLARCKQLIPNKKREEIKWSKSVHLDGSGGGGGHSRECVNTAPFGKFIVIHRCEPIVFSRFIVNCILKFAAKTMW